MRRKIILVLGVFLIMLWGAKADASPPELKVFVSVDMEGICGVIHWEDVSREGKDYGLFRRLMTEEANAVIQGALTAGAEEIVVRDSHGSARNLLPDLLNPQAQLIRDWSGSPLSMMEGIDETFDAALFIGYHARANTPDAVLDHTMTGSIYEVKINGEKMPEAGINALIAGHFGVPVVLVAGDSAVCRQAEELLGERVVTVAVKEGIGEAAQMLHPQKARELIKNKTQEALTNLHNFNPYQIDPPYTMEVTFKNEEDAENATWIPGAKRSGNTSISFTSNDFMEVLKFFKFAR